MIDVQLTDSILDPAVAIAFVSGSQAGGTVVFIGTVRDQTKGKKVVRLEFEAYAPMAILEMEKIAKACKELFQVQKVCIHHRIGILGIGDVPVVIAVSSAHRQAAFEGCQYAIDVLKKEVPIWKKEVFEDGEVWVTAHP